MNNGIRWHARRAASAAHRWMNCAGSIQLADTVLYPPPSSDWAADGTEAHDLLEFCLQNGYRLAGEGYVMAGREWVHRQDDRESRCNSVQTALDHIYDILDSYEDCQLYLEITFQLEGMDDTGGTSDVCIYIPGLKLLHVMDFKHGGGVVVEITHNPQCRIYMHGALQELRKRGIVPDTVVLTIIQPRAFHKEGPIRHWLPTDEEIIISLYEIGEASAKTAEPDAPLTPGVEWCRWCPAGTICPVREERAVKAIVPTFNQVKQLEPATLPAPSEIPLERISDILQAKPFIEDWLEDVRKHAYALAMEGHNIPGQKLVYAQAKRRYEGDPQEIALALCTITGKSLDEIFPRKLIGITDAEPLVTQAYKDAAPKGKKRDAATKAKETFAQFTIKDTSGNLSLVDERDKRPAVNPVTTLFGQVHIPPNIAIEQG